MRFFFLLPSFFSTSRHSKCVHNVNVAVTANCNLRRRYKLILCCDDKMIESQKESESESEDAEWRTRMSGNEKEKL